MTEKKTHARLSPSAAKRWMTCPGSVRLCEAIVDTSSDDADRGTACHSMLEHCLNTGDDPEHFVGAGVDVTSGGRVVEIEVTADMIKWVGEVVAWVRGYLAAHPGAFLRTEERIIIGRAFGCPDDVWGTADIVITAPDELCICDAKFGYVEVPVAENPQLNLYAIGVANDYAWIHDKYRTVIAQPQCGEPKEHTVTREELLDFVSRYRPKIDATFDPDAPLVPSDEGCKWCEAAGVCPKLHERTLALARREFASVETLDVNALASLVQNADRIRAGLKKAEEHALGLAQAGVTIPGMKVVDGDKRRVWKDKGNAAKLLRKLGYKPDDIAPREMITPAQAEKLVGRKTANLLAPLIEKPKGGPTLVSLDDPRPSIVADFTPCDDCASQGGCPGADAGECLCAPPKVLPDRPAKTADTAADLL